MNRSEVKAALAAFPERLRVAAVAAAPSSVPAGEWGPNEVIRHLIAVELDVHQARLDDLATSDDPHWDWAEPEPWPGEPGLSLAALFERFAVLRTATLATVEALDEPGWARTGTHTRLGAFNVRALLVNAIDHDEQHLATLA